MSNVPNVAITYTFNGDTTAQNLVNASQLDTQYGNLSTAQNQTKAALDIITDPTNQLVSQSVGFTQLKAEVRNALLGKFGATLGTAAKTAVRLVGLANVAALSGAATLDGTAVANGDYVLLTAQTTTSQNGLWVVNTAGAWTRRSDLPTGAVQGSGWYALAYSGLTQTGLAWAVYSPGTNIVDTDPMLFLALAQNFAAPITIYTLDTIAQLKGVAAPLFAATYFVRGYYAVGDGGGGLFSWNSSDTTTDNLGTIIIPNAGGTGRWNRIFDKDGIYPVCYFGAKGDGTTDDTAAVSACITAAKANGYPVVRFGAGTFKITAPLPDINVSGYGCSIEGAGKEITIINIAGLSAGVPAFSATGGSGGIAQTTISDLIIIGSGTQYGIRNKGFCGWKFYRIGFRSLGTGIEFSNDAGVGTFTEVSVAYQCVFDSTVTRCLWYHRGTGNDSFHGSGLIDCDINQPSGATSAAIEIGAAAEVGRVVLYNAPMDFRIWIRSTQNIINVVTGKASLVTAHGTIKVEIVTGRPTFAGGDINVYYAGKILLWNSAGSNLGKLVLCEWAAVQPDSSVAYNRIPRRLSTTNSSTSTLTVSSIEENCNLLFLNLSGNNYDYKYVLALHKDNYGGAGSVVIVSTLNAFNVSGWGAPTFSVSAAGVLSIVNAAYVANTITAFVAILTGGFANSYGTFNE